MNLTRQKIRKLIYESLNEISMQGKDVSVNDGNIVVDGVTFGVEANAGMKSAYQFIDVELTDIKKVSSGLQVYGSALGTSVNDLVPTAKVLEINKGVESGKDSFEVQGKKALFRFSRQS